MSWGSCDLCYLGVLWLRNKAAMEKKSVSRLFWRTDLDAVEGVALETEENDLCRPFLFAVAN